MLKLIFCKHFKFSGNFNVLVDKFIFVKKCASLMHENLSISFLHVYHVEKSFTIVRLYNDFHIVPCFQINMHLSN